MKAINSNYGIRTAKLDRYNYTLDFSRYPAEIDIWVEEEKSTSSEIADISTEVNNADGHIYVEDWYLIMKSMEVVKKDSVTYLLIKTKP